MHTYGKRVSLDFNANTCELKRQQIVQSQIEYGCL